MNWSKAKATLSSINRLIAIFEESDELSSIERDLLLKRIQELYEIVLISDTEVEKKKNIPQVKEQVTVSPPTIEKPRVEAKPQSVVTPPVVIEKPKPVIIQQPKAIETPVVIEQPKKVEPTIEKETKTIHFPQTPVNNTENLEEELIDLFEFKSATDLSEKLSDSPIKDLKASMSINERFLTISELFKGNAARYNEVIEVLNGLSNFDQAKSYLTKIVIPEFDWMAEKKQILAKKFIKKVNRRFL